MTGFTPPGTVTHAGVMVHFFSGPGGRAAMAQLAIHRCAIEQLRLWHMVRWLGQSATVIALRNIGATVARLAGSGADQRVIHRDSGAETGLRFMTGIALGNTCWHRNMRGRLAQSRR